MQRLTPGCCKVSDALGQVFSTYCFNISSPVKKGNKMLKTVLLLLNLSEVFGAIAVAPRNTVVRVGEKLVLECRTNNGSKVRKWTHHSTNRSNKNIYKHPDIFDPSFGHFGTEVNADGSGILYTYSTRLEDAGIFGCYATVEGGEEKFTAQVILIESAPQCVTNLTTNVTDDFLVDGAIVWMQCSLGFRGFWTPTVEWKQHNRDDNRSRQLTDRDGVELASITNSKVTSTLTFVVNSSTNGSFVSCTFYLTKYNGMDPNMTATNIPTDSFHWRFDPIMLGMSSTESAANTFESSASSAPIASVTDSGSSYLDWYVVSLATVSALSLFLILAVTVSIAFCVHYKKRVSAKHYATMSSMPTKVESPVPDTYEILPYSVEDNYAEIDETQLGSDNANQPTPEGYAALLPTTPITTPPVYNRAEIHNSPFNTEKKSEETIMSYSKIKEAGPLPYLELLSATSDRSSRDEGSPKSSTGVCHSPAVYDTEMKFASYENVSEESPRTENSNEPLNTKL